MSTYRDSILLSDDDATNPIRSAESLGVPTPPYADGPFGECTLTLEQYLAWQGRSEKVLVTV